MKLSEHVETIRLLIDRSFRNQFVRIGITIRSYSRLKIYRGICSRSGKIEPIPGVYR